MTTCISKERWLGEEWEESEAKQVYDSLKKHWGL